MKRLLLPLLAVAALAGFIVWWFSPLQVVKRRTNSLMSALTIAEGSGDASRQAGSFSLERLLSKKITLEVPAYEDANGTIERGQATTYYSAMAGNAKSTSFKVEEFKMITVSGSQATVVASVQSVVVMPEYHPLDGLYQVELSWQREEDGWRLYRAKWTGGNAPVLPMGDYEN